MIDPSTSDPSTIDPSTSEPSTSDPNTTPHSNLVRVARFPGLRALAWAGDQLYASRGYQVLRATIRDPCNITWQPVANFVPTWQRRLSVTNRFGARVLRDGFHALTVLPSAGLVGAVPGAIVTTQQGEFRATHTITRGTRPLHITAVPGGAIYWGEYFDNASRDEVHVNASNDQGATWNVAYTFPRGAIRHVHNMVHDPWGNCLWVLTGDYGDECRILRVACDFSRVEVVLQGQQQARAVAAIPTEHAIYFSSDTPLEKNYVYRLDREGNLRQLAPLSSSSIYGCRVGSHLFFSTMVEPSEVNRDRAVRIYGADVSKDDCWSPLLSWEKDLLPMELFQYGNAFLPDGNNTTPYLAVTTVAVRSDDMTLSLYSVNS
ncbi:MAG TPA: hypothetical protein VE377_20745 [Candidatus Dormibacteraeota bacterium]|nr:hypothetical protein [Candidatus Dormibacteraeota bacterium]